MFCSNCGQNLNENEKFCPKCGAQVITKNSGQATQTNINKQSEDILKELFKNIKEIMSKCLNSDFFARCLNCIRNFTKKISNFFNNFFKKYKRPSLITIIILIIIISGIILYSNLIGFERLSWNEGYEDYKLNTITSNQVKLGINFSNNDKLEDVKISSSCGKVDSKGLEIDWDLSGQSGECEITVSYKLRKIKKKYIVIHADTIEQKELYLEDKINLDSDEDLDYDKLTNKQEKEYKTNPLLIDSDMDGLDDYYEIFTSKTDPNKKDTDDDELSDYDEVKLDLNPLVSDSKNDGIKDGQRDLTYKFNSNNINIDIKGKGNIVSVVANVTSKTKISDKPGLIDKLYTFYTSGQIAEAIVTINYTDEEVNSNKLNEDKLSLYYYNDKLSRYEKIDTKVDKQKKTLTATLEHFSNYVIGDSSLVKETQTNQILFILDNSWSMYTNEQVEEIIGQEVKGMNGSDSQGVRFSLTSELVTKLIRKGYQVGLSEFREDYVNNGKIGSTEECLKDRLNNMNGKFVTSFAGTNITNALKNGISEFDKEVDNKYIVILTDGQDDRVASNITDITKKALENNVKIYSIGFNEGSYNINLSNISNATGGRFFSSSDADGLTELFDNVKAELNDDVVDIDGDNKNDGILLSDSGFIVNRDGFSFSNYGSNLTSGHCYGMATFAELYYKKQLPLSCDSLSIKSDKSYSYNLKNTYFEKYPNLYNYKLKTNALKYSFGYDIFGEEKPSDILRLSNDSLIYNDKYKSEINESNLYDYVENKKSELDSDSQIKKYGFNYSTYDSILLNEDKMQKSSIIDNNDKQMFNAIYTSFIKQKDMKFYSSGYNFTLWLRSLVGSESIDSYDKQSFINILKSRLDCKDAPVICSDYSGGLHAINAISLVQDIENPNHYYIGVYDNNYPGEKRYIEIECKNDVCVTKSNYYYDKSGEPIRITPSLEYDMKYYNSNK